MSAGADRTPASRVLTAPPRALPGALPPLNVLATAAAGRARPAAPPAPLLRRAHIHTPPACSVMLVGWGGNNGTTVTGGILANKK